MLNEFQGLDRYIPRHYREQLVAAVTAEALSIERLTPDDAGPDPDRDVDLDIRLRRAESSPLRRAARAAVSLLEEPGHRPESRPLTRAGHRVKRHSILCRIPT